MIDMSHWDSQGINGYGYTTAHELRFIRVLARVNQPALRNYAAIVFRDGRIFDKTVNVETIKHALRVELYGIDPPPHPMVLAATSFPAPSNSNPVEQSGVAGVYEDSRACENVEDAHAGLEGPGRVQTEGVLE